MKTPKPKPARTRAARSASGRLDATASAQSQPTPAPAASVPPPPPAPTPPAKRKLFGIIFGGDANGNLEGVLVSFDAEYLPGMDAIRFNLRLADHRLIALNLDHVFARAAIGTHRQALSEFSRFHRDKYKDAWAEPPAHAQLICLRLPDSCPPDEGFQCEFVPQRDLIQLRACFSCGDFSFSATTYLARAEAQALLHDLERALADLERYRDIGT